MEPIIAYLKDGRKVKIGLTSGGHKPKFFILKDWGGRPDSNQMNSWLKENADKICIGSYGITGEMYDNLDPVVFEQFVNMDLNDLKSQVESQDPYGILPYKETCLRRYGGKHKTAYLFTKGIYTDANGWDFTYRHPEFFGE